MVANDTNADYQLSDDDWDELASDDEDRKPAIGEKNPLAGSLKEPRFKTVNLRQLNDLIQFGNVDLDPAYQRDVVWSEPKMIQLIQSLFLNYYVPPVIFAIEFVEKDGVIDEKRICIDGKQRCTSILRFIEGKVPFISPATKEKFWYTKYATGQKGGKALPGALKRKFDNISIQVVEYEDISMDLQRDIFQRVQLGVALSAAEKLQAYAGPWSAWITELQKKYITAPGTIGSLLHKFDIGRGRPFQMLTSFIMMVNTDQRITPSSSTQGNFLKRADAPEPELRRKVEMTLSLLVEICTDLHAEAIATVEQRVAPVEFQFMCYLVYNRMGCMSLKRIARTISDMRQTVRANLIDIRSNTTTTREFYDFMDKVPRTKQPGEIAAAEEYESDQQSLRQQRANKRRREEEERDQTYRPDPNAHLVRDGPESAVIEGLRSKKPKAITPATIKTSPPSSSAAPPPAPTFNNASAGTTSQAYQPRPMPQLPAAAQEYIPVVRPPAMPMDAPLPVQNVPPPAYTTHTVRNQFNQGQHHQQNRFNQNQPPQFGNGSGGYRYQY